MSLKLTLPDSSLLRGQCPSDQAAAHPSLAPAAHPRQQHQIRSWGTSSSSHGVDNLLPSLPCGSCSCPGGGEEPGRVSCSIWFIALWQLKLRRSQPQPFTEHQQAEAVT